MLFSSTLVPDILLSACTGVRRLWAATEGADSHDVYNAKTAENTYNYFLGVDICTVIHI